MFEKYLLLIYTVYSKMLWKPEVDICSSFLGVKKNVWPLPIWQPHYENLVTPKGTGIVVSFQETIKKDVATRWPSLKSIFNLLPEITNSYKNYILQWILVKLAKKSYFLKENCMLLNQHGHPAVILENEYWKKYYTSFLSKLIMNDTINWNW